MAAIKEYLKKFDTNVLRETYENSDDYLEPYVSFVEEDDSVHFNVKPIIEATFNISMDNDKVCICRYEVTGTDVFSKIEIDGVEVPISSIDAEGGYYTFPTAGNHTVKYTLIDPIIIDELFNYCTSLLSVTISNSVTSIGDNAFRRCSGLISINIPNSVTTIGEMTFASCVNLSSVTIGNGVTTISEGAFSNCYKLTSITIPSNITSIGDYAFGHCSGLTSIDIPSSVTFIGNRTFNNCINLSSITIPSSVNEIGNEAFESCSSLTSITIPSSVTSIGNGALRECYFTSNNFHNNSDLDPIEYGYWGATIVDSDTNGFVVKNNELFVYRGNSENVVIPNGITSIEGVIGESKKRISITIPSSVTEVYFADNIYVTNVILENGFTSIGEGAFYGCVNLSSITIPNSVTTIDYYAFGDCSFALTNFHNNSTCSDSSYWGAMIMDSDTNGLLIENNSVYRYRGIEESVTIPNSVTSIGNNAFYENEYVKSVTIGSGVTSIGEEAFNFCYNLESVTLLATTPPTLSSYPFVYNAPNRKIYVPSASVDAYKAAEVWSNCASIILPIPNE